MTMGAVFFVVGVLLLELFLWGALKKPVDCPGVDLKFTWHLCEFGMLFCMLIAGQYLAGVENPLAIFSMWWTWIIIVFSGSLFIVIRRFIVKLKVPKWF